jgi:hypothetical protein
MQAPAPDMKSTRIIYWTTTVLVVLMEGLMPLVVANNPEAAEGIRHLGYPDYFRQLLLVFKVLGSLGLLLPMVRGRYKEWAYAGFTVVFISASVSHWAVDGFTQQAILPLILLSILTVSYFAYHRLHPAPKVED